MPRTIVSRDVCDPALSLLDSVEYCWSPMLAGQRQLLILEEVRRRGAVRVSELTALLDVSDMTVRRDLDVLSASGLVDKVHGGATLPGRLSADEPGFEAKSTRQL